ncbi:hypothetical protein [Tateyamaria sp.]|uniref:hypothetical protein n=1 Tax=Tateyamaria sp. TaxID=1929288 RepID=UPI00329E56A0
MENLLKFSIIFAMVFGVLAAHAADKRTHAVPVMLFPDSDHPLCSIGLQVNAGGADLRSGPGKEYPVIATFEAGRILLGCDERHGWDGIVDGHNDTCGLDAMIAEVTPYSGPCRSGWIDRHNLTSIFG